MKKVEDRFLLVRPKCSCLQCNRFAMIYRSIGKSHLCVECNIEFHSGAVEDLVHGFSTVYKQIPKNAPQFEDLSCLGCRCKGGVIFKKSLSFEMVSCNKCNFNVYINRLQELMINAYKTKLIEKVYGFRYPLESEDIG